MLFLIGVAALVLIGNNVIDQFCNCHVIGLDLSESVESKEDNPKGRDSRNAVKSEPEPVQLSTKADQWLEQLQRFDWAQKKQYLWRRLVSALSFVQRTNSTAGIEDELKYLSDVDRDRKHHRYSLVRILIWATPMLGFLGTVLGISEALGGIQVGADNNFQQMLNGLRASLFVAFDTTALALTLSIVLMFMQFFTDRFESNLLDIVDQRTHEELSPIYGSNLPEDPQSNVLQVEAFERASQGLLTGAQQLLQIQSRQWARHLQDTETTMNRSATGFSQSVKSELCDSINASSTNLAGAMSEMTQCVNEQVSQSYQKWQQLLDRNANNMSERWNQWQVALSDNARQMTQSQELVPEQLHLTREVLREISDVQEQLHGVAEHQAEQQQPEPELIDEPAPQIIRLNQAANRINKIYRFVTKPADSSEAA